MMFIFKVQRVIEKASDIRHTANMFRNLRLGRHSLPRQLSIKPLHEIKPFEVYYYVSFISLPERMASDNYTIIISL